MLSLNGWKPEMAWLPIWNYIKYNDFIRVRRSISLYASISSVMLTFYQYIVIFVITAEIHRELRDFYYGIHKTTQLFMLQGGNHSRFSKMLELFFTVVFSLSFTFLLSSNFRPFLSSFSSLFLFPTVLQPLFHLTPVFLSVLRFVSLVLFQVVSTAFLLVSINHTINEGGLVQVHTWSLSYDPHSQSQWIEITRKRINDSIDGTYMTQLLFELHISKHRCLVFNMRFVYNMVICV